MEPTADTRSEDGPLLGREAELARLESFWASPSATLVLSGEAGIGKTTLWDTGLSRARELGWQTLAASPASAESDLPYAVLGDLLGTALRGPVVTMLPAPQRRALEVALLLAPAAGAPPDPRAVALATTATLGALAGRQRLVVAVDDCQWMDRASAEALAFALRRVPPERVKSLVTMRSGHEPPAVVAAARGTERLAVGPLTFGAAHRLLARALDGDATYAVARRLHERANGNPLHLLELARSLATRWPWTPDSVIPPADLAELLEQRVSRLPEGCRDVLLHVSAMSRPSVELLVAALAGAGERDLHECVAAGLLRTEGDRLRFTHPLYAAACYRAEPTRHRRAVHARLAAVVDDPERRARHLALADPEPGPEVAALLDDGARSARARGAPHAAAELAEHARRLTPSADPSARVRRTRDLAHYLLEAGESGYARRTLELLLTSQEAGPERARTLVALSEVLFEEEGVQAMREVAWQALAEAADEPGVTAEAHLVLAERAELPADEALDHAERSLAFLERAAHPDPALLANALRQVAIARWQQGAGISRDLVDRSTLLESGLDLPPPVAWRARTCMAECLKYLDGFEEADRLLAECDRAAEQEGDLSSMSDLAGHRAELALWLGRWDEAAEHAARAVESARFSEQRGRLGLAEYFQALVRAHRGELAEARRQAGDLLVRCTESDDRWCAALSRTVLAFVARSSGDPIEAAVQLGAVDAFSEEAVLAEPRQRRYLGDYVEALVLSGDLGLAGDRLARLEGWAELMGTGPSRACWLRARGVLAEAEGSTEQAMSDLTEAVRLYDEHCLPFERARARTLLGAAQRRARYRHDARETLTRAADEFASLGAAAWTGIARSELARVSGRHGTSAQLTASEGRVAELVARGLTNKQVASALVVTPRTVEAHLTRIYAKLGVHSRVELARAIARGRVRPDQDGGSRASGAKL